MKFMFTITLDTPAGNRAFQNGTIGDLLQKTFELLRPEASYFSLEGGRRACHFFADLQDPMIKPQIAELWFQGADATVHVLPVLTGDQVRGAIGSFQGR